MRKSRFAGTVALVLGLGFFTAQPTTVSSGHRSADSRGRGDALLLWGGMPFGGRTLVADFDADGAPDIATTERAAQNGSQYRIALQLSRGQSGSLGFTSVAGALRIDALDIDSDRDLDLIARPIFDADVVGVWINDGAGHFRQGVLPALRSIGLCPAHVNDQRDGRFVVATTHAPKRTWMAASTRLANVWAVDLAAPYASRHGFHRRRPDSISLPPRAPPAGLV